MAILTPLSLEDARRIGAPYDLEIAAVRGILAGSVNSNYALTLVGGGQVFLRVYEEQQTESAAREARMLDHLCAGGVITPQPLRRRARHEAAADASDRDRFIAEHAGKPVALFPWVAGESLCQAQVQPAALRRLGAALAQVHATGASFPDAGGSRFNLDALAGRLRAIHERKGQGAPIPPDVEQAIHELGVELERIRAEAPNEPGPQTLIHGDLFRDNVLWQGGEITALLDFESASRGSAAFDLAVTMLAWCYGDDLRHDLVAALFEGYTAVRQLSAEERGRLLYESKVASLRFSITRITDFELRPRGSGVYKDFRRFMARRRSLDRLGAEGLLRLLRR